MLHKYSFKRLYKNVATGVEEVVCTNQIEGAWKHAKDHFRRMSGTKVRQFEGHLAEIMWRSEFKGNLYGGFFECLKSIFTLQSSPDYQYTTPLFDSWNIDAESTVAPINTDAENSTSEAESEDSYITPNRYRERSQSYQLMISSMISLVQRPPHLYQVPPPLECPGQLSIQLQFPLLLMRQTRL